MKRIRNTDIQFKLDTKLINVSNFNIKFYTVNAENFFIKKTQEDVYTVERPATIEDAEVIASGGTTVTDYYLGLDWSELVNIGQGVMQYQAVNNINLEDFVDLWYNKGITRTTEYYIDSDIVLSDKDGKNVLEKIDDVNKDLQKEVIERIDGDLALADRIDYIVEHLDSGGSIDVTKYYLKTETSGATELETAFNGKQNQLIAGDNITISGNVISSTGGGGDMSNYYTKQETSGKSEIAIALNDKADKSNTYTKSQVDTAIANVDVSDQLQDYLLISAYTDDSEVIAAAINDLNDNKLDSSAYTPTDLTNYYTKSQTSGASEIATALGTKQNSLIAGDNITISGNVISSTGGGGDMSNYYTKQETSGATEIATALGNKLDSTAYTPTDLTNYYTKSETSGKTEIANALNDKADKSNTYTKSETSGATEIASALNAKLDTTAYTPTDLTNYYTKTQTSGASEISTALGTKLDATAYTPTDLTNYYTKSQTSGATELETALGTKLDSTAYTPTDLTNYYTKLQTSGASEISTALGTKLDATAYTPTDLTNYYTKSQTSAATELETAFNLKQNQLIAGDNISISGNVISSTGGGGGGKAIVAGSGIAITTGDTADTVSLNVINEYYGTVNLATSDRDVYNGSIMIGRSYAKNIDHAIAIGTTQRGVVGGAFIYGNEGIGIGNNVKERSRAGIVIGNFSSAGTSDTQFGSTAIGYMAESYGNCSTALSRTKVNNESEFGSGQYNVSSTASTTFGDSGNTLFSVGNGTSNSARHNAFEIRQNGDIYLTKDGQDVKLQDTIAALGGLKLQQISQSDYDNLGTYDNSTLYIIV